MEFTCEEFAVSLLHAEAGSSHQPRGKTIACLSVHMNPHLGTLSRPVPTDYPDIKMHTKEKSKKFQDSFLPLPSHMAKRTENASNTKKKHTQKTALLLIRVLDSEFLR